MNQHGNHSWHEHEIGLWTFHKTEKGKKILTLLTFRCPTN